MFKTLKVLFLMAISVAAVAQKGTHSPYSIFGLGELKQNDYAAFSSMGGVSMAGSDSTMVNHINPASYVYIGRYRPILQVGIDGRFSNFETTNQQTTQRHFGLNQFQLGLPIRKRWGAAVGLKPYSFTGYQVSNYTVVDDDSTQLNTSEGSGGITNFYFGLGYQPVNNSKKRIKQITRKDSSGVSFIDSIRVERTHHLSFGTNANYLFGSSDQIRTFQYASTISGFNSKVKNSLRFSGLIYDFGVNYMYRWSKSNYDKSLPKSNAISVGLAYSPGIKVRAFQDLISYSYLNFGGFNGSETISDTIEFVQDNKGNAYIPEAYKFGIEYRVGPNSQSNSNLLRIGFDAKYQKWSIYQEDFGVDFENQMKDRLSLAVGLEWTPVTYFNDRTPFFGKVHYRLGFDYTQTEWQVLNNTNNYTDLNAYGMSFGLGFPVTIIRNSNTNINFGANLGNLGTTENGLIKEKYLGLYFGVAITPGSGDLWFVKRKYD